MLLSNIQFCATPWAGAHQISPSMKIFRQEYLNGLPSPTPGDLLTQIKPTSLCLLQCQADFLPLHHLGSQLRECRRLIFISNREGKPVLPGVIETTYKTVFKEVKCDQFCQILLKSFSKESEECHMYLTIWTQRGK